MTTQTEALKLALEALEIFAASYSDGNEAITAIKEALAEDELCSSQEPMAIVAVDGVGQIQVGWIKKPKHNDKLYTTPPKRQPLTVDEVWQSDQLMSLNAQLGCGMDLLMEVVGAIEAAHGIKENT